MHALIRASEPASVLAARLNVSPATIQRRRMSGLSDDQISQQYEGRQPRIARPSRRALARELGVSVQTIWRHQSRGLSDSQIKQATAYHRTLEGIPPAERWAFRKNNPPPPFVKLGGGGAPKGCRCAKRGVDCKHQPQPSPRYCDECGTQVPKGKQRFCSQACGVSFHDRKARADRAQAILARPARYCLRCGVELPAIVNGRWNLKRDWCSARCCRTARSEKKPGRRHKGGLLITTVGADKWPHHGTVVFTAEGIEFVAARLLTKSTYPEIAASVGINVCTFKRLMRETPELTLYKKKHYEIAGQLKGPNKPKERQAACTHCGATYTKYRNERGHFSQRRRCDQCVAAQQAPKPPKALTNEQLERRKSKAREQYQKHKEAKKQRYREYYARTREAQVDKTRRNKAIKRHGLDPERWKEQWQVVQAAKKRRRKEKQWIKQGRKALAKVRTYLSQRV